MSCLRRGNLSGHQKNGYRLTSAVATLSLADGWQIDSMAFAMMIVLSSMEIIKSFELSLSVSYCSRNLCTARGIFGILYSLWSYVQPTASPLPGGLEDALSCSLLCLGQLLFQIRVSRSRTTTIPVKEIILMKISLGS